MTVKVSTTDIRDLTRAVTKHAFQGFPIGNAWGNILSGCKCCAKHLNKETFLVGQGVLQTSQISRSCAIVSMSY